MLDLDSLRERRDRRLLQWGLAHALDATGWGRIVRRPRFLKALQRTVLRGAARFRTFCGNATGNRDLPGSSIQPFRRSSPRSSLEVGVRADLPAVGRFRWSVEITKPPTERDWLQDVVLRETFLPAAALAAAVIESVVRCAPPFHSVRPGEWTREVEVPGWNDAPDDWIADTLDERMRTLGLALGRGAGACGVACGRSVLHFLASTGITDFASREPGFGESAFGMVLHPCRVVQVSVGLAPFLILVGLSAIGGPEGLEVRLGCWPGFLGSSTGPTVFVAFLDGAHLEDLTASVGPELFEESGRSCLHGTAVSGAVRLGDGPTRGFHSFVGTPAQYRFLDDMLGLADQAFLASEPRGVVRAARELVSSSSPHERNP